MATMVFTSSNARFRNSNPNWPHRYTQKSWISLHRKRVFFVRCSSTTISPKPPHSLFIHLTASAILFVGFASGARASVDVNVRPTVESCCEPNPDMEHVTGESNIVENIEDMELKAALESWKSKTFALTVPLRVVALRGSVPPSWIKVYLRRDGTGELDLGGKIWAVPYRWGSMVIAYKKNKFRKHNMAPIEDWSDLWRPELAGKISMVDCPREVVGAVLKYMGASYNTMDIDTHVTGGMKATMQNLMLLQKQVRLFDSVHYIKAFGVGDVWVAVGWSSDVLPAVKRMSDVAVIVPKSGASLWADLWAIPAAQRFVSNCIGGRVRGPSPLVQQWVEFCLQAARALPLKQEVVPGASPIDHEDQSESFEQLTKGKPKLDTNLIAGVPPPEILVKCEFVEPLPESALKDYQMLIDSMQKPGPGLISNMQHHISSVIHSFG